MKTFTRYLDAARYCVSKGLDPSRIVRKGHWRFVIARSKS